MLIASMARDDIVCPYKSRCTGFPTKCNKCRHNLGKKDYFEPIFPEWTKFDSKPFKPR